MPCRTLPLFLYFVEFQEWWYNYRVISRLGLKAQNTANSTKLSIRSQRIILSISGIIVNTILSFILYKSGVPLYLDTLGTITVAALTANLFPAICTAIGTSVLCSFFYWPAIYLSSFNAIIAVITVFFVRKKSFKQIGKLFIYVPVVALISTLSVSLLQYALNGLNDTSITAKNALAFSSAASAPYLLSFCVTNLMFYILEKWFICIFVILLINLLPKKLLASLNEENLNQQIVSQLTRQYVSEIHKNMKNPLHKRIVFTFVISAVILVIMTEAIALRLYFDNTKKEKTQRAYSCVNLAADCIDPDRIEDYLKYGSDAPGYNETFIKLSKLHKSFDDIAYLYVLKIEEGGCRFIFDTDEVQPYSTGELVPFDKEFEEFLPVLFDGKDIEPVESDNIFGWLLTIYKPVINDEGITVSYIGADVSMRYVAGYMGRFILKVFLIMAGFFIVIISYIYIKYF